MKYLLLLALLLAPLAVHATVAVDTVDAVAGITDAGSVLTAAPVPAAEMPVKPMAPEVKLGAAAGLVLVVVKLLMELAKTAALGSVWGKMNPLIKVAVLATLGGCAAFLTSYTTGAGLFPSVGAAFLGIMGAVQHGNDLAPPSATA